jgi:hypothetical protein
MRHVISKGRPELGGTAAESTQRPLQRLAVLIDNRANGLLPNYRAIQRSDIDPNDDERIEALRAHCPPSDGDARIDLDVAKRLLSDPQLYICALGVHSSGDTNFEQI